MSKDTTPCCNAAYGVGGKGMTHWYQCTACGKPLDPFAEPVLSEEESEALLLRSEHGIC